MIRYSIPPLTLSRLEGERGLGRVRQGQNIKSEGQGGARLHNQRKRAISPTGVQPRASYASTGAKAKKGVKLPKGQYVFHVVPCPAPRMTRADAWKQRPCVLRYRAFRDRVRALAGTQDYHLQETLQITFILPMPPSWSAQKRRYHDGQPHQQRPDFDNLLKAWCDVWGIDDGFVWRVRGEKRWGVEGRIEVTDKAAGEEKGEG